MHDPTDKVTNPVFGQIWPNMFLVPFPSFVHKSNIVKCATNVCVVAKRVKNTN